MGAQMLVFVERLQRQLESIERHEYCAKFGGATGGLNAHYAAVPEVNWHRFADRFLAEHCDGLHRLQNTTQVAHNDSLAALLDNLRRVNVILLDLAQDMWMYIGMGYFVQRITVGQVGSSCMPHKVSCCELVSVCICVCVCVCVYVCTHFVCVI
jgi:adenylosuccinate lyase